MRLTFLVWSFWTPHSLIPPFRDHYSRKKSGGSGNKSGERSVLIIDGVGKKQVERLQKQNKLASFEEAVLPHLNAAYNLAHWLTRNDADAEDVVQEAYLRA